MKGNINLWKSGWYMLQIQNGFSLSNIFGYTGTWRSLNGWLLAQHPSQDECLPEPTAGDGDPPFPGRREVSPYQLQLLPEKKGP
jgi:hypothetical protein